MSYRLDNLQTQRLNAGWTITELASRANCSDWLIRTLENGGDCEADDAQRIADALGVTLTTLGKADLG